MHILLFYLFFVLYGCHFMFTVSVTYFICLGFFLDVYVFGVGEDVKKSQLNELASKKRGETHVFTLKDYQTLGRVFNSIISKFEMFD